MSPSTSVLAGRFRRRAVADQGFTLVEVIVALMIFGVIAAAAVPMLVSAGRLATIAKLSTQAKQLSVERVEAMRNLPYYVAFDAGQYRDVLDVYFRDLQVAGALEANDPCTARAYKAASNTYRCTIDPIPSYPAFRQQVDVQFLTATRAVVVPRATYNARGALTNQDIPVSGLLGVTVTTTWIVPGGSKSSVLRTEIANVSPADRRIVSEAGATAVEIGSTLSNGQIVQFQAGLFNASGALSTAASAAHSTVGAQANYLSGNSVQGASASASAPADETAGGSTAVGQRLDPASCYPVCFGSTSVTGDLKAQVSTGLPTVSSSGASMASGKLLRSDIGSVGGLSFTNALPGELDTSLLLEPTAPLVFFVDGPSSETAAEASGYLTSTKNGNSVRGYASAATKRLRFLPTSFAPDGLIRIRLNSSSIDCNNVSGSGLVTAAWDATVSWWTSAGSYASHTLTPTSTGLPDPSTIDVFAGLKLSHWIDGWGGLSSGAAIVESTGTLARGKLPVVVSVTSKPTRGPLDPASAVGIEIGSLTCTAEDLR